MSKKPSLSSANTTKVDLDLKNLDLSFLKNESKLDYSNVGSHTIEIKSMTPLVSDEFNSEVAMAYLQKRQVREFNDGELKYFTAHFNFGLSKDKVPFVVLPSSWNESTEWGKTICSLFITKGYSVIKGLYDVKVKDNSLAILQITKGLIDGLMWKWENHKLPHRLTKLDNLPEFYRTFIIYKRCQNYLGELSSFGNSCLDLDQRYFGNFPRQTQNNNTVTYGGSLICSQLLESGSTYKTFNSILNKLIDLYPLEHVDMEDLIIKCVRPYQKVITAFYHAESSTFKNKKSKKAKKAEDAEQISPDKPSKAQFLLPFENKFCQEVASQIWCDAVINQQNYLMKIKELGYTVVYNQISSIYGLRWNFISSYRKLLNTRKQEIKKLAGRGTDTRYTPTTVDFGVWLASGGVELIKSLYHNLNERFIKFDVDQAWSKVTNKRNINQMVINEFLKEMSTDLTKELISKKVDITKDINIKLKEFNLDRYAAYVDIEDKLRSLCTTLFEVEYVVFPKEIRNKPEECLTSDKGNYLTNRIADHIGNIAGWLQKHEDNAKDLNLYRSQCVFKFDQNNFYDQIKALTEDNTMNKYSVLSLGTYMLTEKQKFFLKAGRRQFITTIANLGGEDADVLKFFK